MPDDPELTRLRAAHSQWQITCAERVFVTYTAVKGSLTIYADDLGRLERALAEADTGKGGH